MLRANILKIHLNRVHQRRHRHFHPFRRVGANISHHALDHAQRSTKLEGEQEEANWQLEDLLNTRAKGDMLIVLQFKQVKALGGWCKYLALLVR